MKNVIRFLSSNTVLLAAFAAAFVSAFFVPPSMAYFGYIDRAVIILLFCLMAAVAGLRSLGVFDALSARLLSKTTSSKAIAFILMNLCFFSSMLVTNDVALITFVPLTLGLYRSKGGSQQLIMTVVIETAAANLGSMMTPIGNPQNLFLYSHYEMSMGDFFSAAIPLGICGYLLLCGSVMLVKNGTAELKEETARLDIGWRLWAYIAVFAVCVLSVAGIVSEYICLALTAAVLLAADRGLFAKVDYPLLATFICFFIFVGNLGNIPTISSFIEKLLSGKELIVSALLSQVISNVPAAAMLAGFTDNAAALLKGVNIGGLGTPVASLASLISFRYYSAAADSRKGKYMAVFLGVNFALLAIMLALGYIIP